MSTPLQVLPSSKYYGQLPDHRQLARNIGVLWADCYSEKPMFQHIFKDNTPEERYQNMIWIMERRARLSLARYQGQLFGEGTKSAVFWCPPGQKLGFHPLQLVKEGFARVPFKFGYGVFRRIADVSFHEIEACKKHRKADMWTGEGLGVSPHHQGQGFGSKMIGSALADIEARGERLFLMTHNPENIPFYERLGCRLVDELKLKNSAVVGYCFVR